MRGAANIGHNKDKRVESCQNVTFWVTPACTSPIFKSAPPPPSDLRRLQVEEPNALLYADSATALLIVRSFRVFRDHTCLLLSSALSSTPLSVPLTSGDQSSSTALPAWARGALRCLASARPSQDPNVVWLPRAQARIQTLAKFACQRSVNLSCAASTAAISCSRRMPRDE